MSHVATARTGPAATRAVCTLLLLGTFLLSQTASAEDLPPATSQTTLSIRAAATPRPSPPPKSRPWEKTTQQIGLQTQPPPGRLPADSFTDLVPAAQRASVPARPTRGWGNVSLNWVPSEIVHQPLYFDDQGLERYGQTICPALQPALSGARFFATFPIVPYKIGLDRPYDCVSTAGYVRTGRCAPPVCERLPLRLDASLLESGTWIGLVFLFP